MKSNTLFILFYLLFFSALTVDAQINFPSVNIDHPQPATLRKGMGLDNTSGTPFNPFSQSAVGNKTAMQNQALLEEVREHERIRRLQNHDLIQEYSLSYVPLPDYQNLPGTSSFFSASQELTDMLSGEKPLNLKRAVFISENAWFDNQLSYKDFDKEIQNLKNICLLKMGEEKLNLNDNLAKLMMIFRIMTDEISVEDPTGEGSITHYPMKYDFNDYMGRDNRTNIFVSKLLSTNTGQCHSLPLLFLILAEELDAEAYLAFSPEHMYIKFQDKQGRWHNMELTTGKLATDDFYMNSGFIKAEAIRNKIYMSPLNKQEVVAQILAETAQSYTKKYGFDEFVSESVTTSLEYYPNNMFAHGILSDYHTMQAMYVIRSIGSPAPEIIHLFPQAHELLMRMYEYYEIMDNLGYEKMPEDMYQKWLQQVDIAKDLPENQPSMFKQIKR